MIGCNQITGTLKILWKIPSGTGKLAQPEFIPTNLHKCGSQLYRAVLWLPRDDDDDFFLRILLFLIGGGGMCVHMSAVTSGGQKRALDSPEAGNMMWVLGAEL